MPQLIIVQLYDLQPTATKIKSTTATQIGSYTTRQDGVGDTDGEMSPFSSGFKNVSSMACCITCKVCSSCSKVSLGAWERREGERMMAGGKG